MASFREFSRTESWGSEAWKALCKVRESTPLVQCITNYVSMDIMANSLLAAGASPAMVHAIEEISEFTSLCHALCINIGTLSPDWIFSMKAAAIRANVCQKPWVLDPVGVGATRFRTEKCIELINLKPCVIRGNASEIMAVVGASIAPTKFNSISPAARLYSLEPFMGWTNEEEVKNIHFKRTPLHFWAQFYGEKDIYFMARKYRQEGVDSTRASTDALEAAKELARAAQTVVAVTGAVDLVTDGKRVLGVSNGVALMQRITATGCAVTALIAAFVSVNPSRVLESTAIALALFGLAGELGAEKANGPASLRMHLIDALHMLDEQSVMNRVRIAQL